MNTVREVFTDLAANAPTQPMAMDDDYFGMFLGKNAQLLKLPMFSVDSNEKIVIVAEGGQGRERLAGHLTQCGFTDVQTFNSAQNEVPDGTGVLIVGRLQPSHPLATRYGFDTTRFVAGIFARIAL